MYVVWHFRREQGRAGGFACQTSEHVRISFRDDVETARACGAGWKPGRQAQPNSSTSGDLRLENTRGTFMSSTKSESTPRAPNDTSAALGPWSGRRTACPTHFGSQPKHLENSKR